MLGCIKASCSTVSGGNGVAGVVREVVDVDGTVDLLGQPVIILQQGLGTKVEVVGRQDHDGVGTGVQAVVGERNDLVGHHAGGTDDQLGAVGNLFDGKAGHLPALLHIHGEELAGAALHQDAIHTVFNQIVVQPLLADEVQSAVLIEQGNCGNKISRIHKVLALS